MLLLFKLMIYAALLMGLGYGAAYLLAENVEPERREIIITLPTPKPIP